MLRPSLLPQWAGDPIQWMYPISRPKWLVRVWEYDPILANKRRVRTCVQVWTFVQGIAEGRCRGILFLWTWYWEDVGWEILPSCCKWFRELVQEWSKQRNAGQGIWRFWGLLTSFGCLHPNHDRTTLPVVFFSSLTIFVLVNLHWVFRHLKIIEYLRSIFLITDATVRVSFYNWYMGHGLTIQSHQSYRHRVEMQVIDWPQSLQDDLSQAVMFQTAC